MAEKKATKKNTVDSVKANNSKALAKKIVKSKSTPAAKTVTSKKVDDKPKEESKPATEKVTSKKVDDKPKEESKPATEKVTSKELDDGIEEYRKPYSEVTTMVHRQNWKKNDLFNMITETYPNDKVKMEELNKTQICFFVGEDRLPTEGYFSVISSFI
jgi:hypothetical protein